MYILLNVALTALHIIVSLLGHVAFTRIPALMITSFQRPGNFGTGCVTLRIALRVCDVIACM